MRTGATVKLRARRREADAQRLVPLHQIARRFAQRLPIELAVQIERDRFIEGAGSRIAELGAEPNFHLAFGELALTLARFPPAAGQTGPPPSSVR